MTTNAELLARRQAAVPRGVNTAHPVFAVRASNAEIWDVEGKRYIDFVGGIGVQNTGHRRRCRGRSIRRSRSAPMKAISRWPNG
jgi:4-aminobutyrate aminotransferase-like enzyme